MANEEGGPTSSGQDSGRTVRDIWIEQVFSTPLVSAEVKVLLLSLAHFGMDPSGRVSIPRELIAARVCCHPRKVTDKLRTAIGAGLLRQVVRGQKHRTAVYVAAGPGIPQGADTRPAEPHPQGAGKRPPERSQGADTRPPETNSQGDKKRHPENRQGADSRPAEASQGADSRPPSMYRDSSVSNSVEVESGSLFGEDTAAKRRTPSPAKKSQRKPETPVPDLFLVTDEMRAWAAEKSITVNLDRETERFINHAHEKDRRCRDWIAAWRNWVLRAQEYTDRDAARHRGTGTNGIPGHGALASVNSLWNKETRVEV